MQLMLRQQNDSAYEAMLDDLIQEVFGFSFAPWFAQKLWDERYESYAVCKNGRMLANVCVFKTELLIGGQPVRALQFGAVATRLEERNRGYSRLLMESVLNKYPHTPAFLAANPSVRQFYPRFDFSEAALYRPTLIEPINNPGVAATRLAVEDKLLREALYGRRAFSKLLDITNAQPVHIFHLLLEYAENIFYLPGCGAIVIAEQNGDKLFMADIIAQHPLGWEEIRNELPFCGVQCVEFGFCPDWLGVQPQWRPVNHDESPFFLRGEWDLPQFCRFPALAET